MEECSDGEVSNVIRLSDSRKFSAKKSRSEEYSLMIDRLIDDWADFTHNTGADRIRLILEDLCRVYATVLRGVSNYWPMIAEWLPQIREITKQLSFRKMNWIKYEKFVVCLAVYRKFACLLDDEMRKEFFIRCCHGWFVRNNRTPKQLKPYRDQLIKVAAFKPNSVLTEDGVWGPERNDYRVTFRAWEYIHGCLSKKPKGSEEIIALLTDYLSQKRRRFRSKEKLNLFPEKKSVLKLTDHPRHCWNSANEKSVHF